MAPRSSCLHRYITLSFALLSMYAIRLATGASRMQDLRMRVLAGSPSPGDQMPAQSFPGLGQSPSAAPSPAPSWAPAVACSPSPSPSPSPYPSPTPYLATAPTLTQGSRPESLRRRVARVLGLVLVTFVGMLQAFVVLFLFVKRQQMLKHMYGPHHARRDPAHIWTNA